MNPKFKVGDKVQVVECIDGGYYQVGTIFTVKEVYQNNRYPLKYYEKIIYFFEEGDSLVHLLRRLLE